MECGNNLAPTSRLSGAKVLVENARFGMKGETQNLFKIKNTFKSTPGSAWSAQDGVLLEPKRPPTAPPPPTHNGGRGGGVHDSPSPPFIQQGRGNPWGFPCFIGLYLTPRSDPRLIHHYPPPLPGTHLRIFFNLCVPATIPLPHS